MFEEKKAKKTQKEPSKVTDGWFKKRETKKAVKDIAVKEEKKKIKKEDKYFITSDGRKLSLNRPH